MSRYAPTLTAIGAAFLLSGTVHASEDKPWSYEGEIGPDNWGELSAEFEACGQGRMQSPIDLAAANAVGDLEFSVDWKRGPLMVLNNGYTVQANFQEGSYMTSGGKVFRLVQVHFHTPSEHTVDGETFPLVAHFVHATDDGELGVLGVMFEEGEANDALQKIVAVAGDAGPEARRVRGERLDPNHLLPDDLEIYRYMGSLTTPPCSEGVHWHVAEEPVTASAEQIEAMDGLMGMNARPTLPLNGRLLVEPE